MLIANSPHDGELAILINASDANTISHALTLAAAELARSGTWDQNYTREMELLGATFGVAFYALQTAPEGGDPDGLPTLNTITYHRNAGEADNG